MFRGLPYQIVGILALSLITLGCATESSEEPSEFNGVTSDGFSIMAITPSNGADNVPADSPISVRLNSVVDGSSMGPSTFFVMDEWGNRVLGYRGMRVEPETGTTTLTFYPDMFRLLLGERYIVQVTSGLRDTQFRTANNQYSVFRVTTQAQDVADGRFLRVLSITPGNIITGTGQSPMRYLGFNKRTPIYVRFSEPVKSATFSGDFGPIPLASFPSMTIRVVTLLWNEAIDSAIQRTLDDIRNGNKLSDIEGTVRGGLGGRRFVFEPSEDYPEIYLSVVLVVLHHNFYGTMTQKTLEEEFVVGGFAFTNGFEFKWQDPRAPLDSGGSGQ